MAARSLKQVKAFADMMDAHRIMVAEGRSADEVLTSVLQASGYITELQTSTDPQDETRLENLEELVSVAAEFVTTRWPRSWSASRWWRTRTRCRTRTVTVAW